MFSDFTYFYFYLFLFYSASCLAEKQQIPTVWSFFIVLAHWNNIPRVDMSLHSDTLFWLRANQLLLFLLNVSCLAEKQHIPIV